MFCILNLQMSTKVKSTATIQDWVLALTAIPPSPSPFFIFAPRLIRKIRVQFNQTWYRLYNETKHNQYLKDSTGLELDI